MNIFTQFSNITIPGSTPVVSCSTGGLGTVFRLNIPGSPAVIAYVGTKAVASASV